jgi:hypothetical protein
MTVFESSSESVFGYAKTAPHRNNDGGGGGLALLIGLEATPAPPNRALKARAHSVMCLLYRNGMTRKEASQSSS